MSMRHALIMNLQQTYHNYHTYIRASRDKNLVGEIPAYQQFKIALPSCSVGV